jgi:hypothetical protein
VPRVVLAKSAGSQSIATAVCQILWHLNDLAFFGYPTARSLAPKRLVANVVANYQNVTGSIIAISTNITNKAIKYLYNNNSKTEWRQLPKRRPYIICIRQWRMSIIAL